MDSYTDLGDISSVSTSPSSGVTNTELYSYDAAQRLTEIEHADGKTFSIAYNGVVLDLTTDEAGTLNEYEFTPVTNELSSIEEPSSKVRSWTHDGDSDLTAFEDARTYTTTYTYGLGGELKKATYPDPSDWTYNYDNVSNTRVTALKIEATSAAPPISP